MDRDATRTPSDQSDLSSMTSDANTESDTMYGLRDLETASNGA